MKQIRIGKDFDVRWAILTNGEVVDLQWPSVTVSASKGDIAI